MSSDVDVRLQHLEREMRLMRKDIRLLSRELKDDFAAAIGETHALIKEHLDAHARDPELASVPQFMARHWLVVILGGVGLLSILMRTAEPWAMQLIAHLR